MAYLGFKPLQKIEQTRGNLVGERLFDYLHKGIENLCSAGLLVLNTKKLAQEQWEFSYYWTPLGNEVLCNMEFIDKQEVQDRWGKMPEQFRYLVL